MGNQKNSTRVSVITPFLNAERFIDEAIQSVLAQTYADWELLLIDDGSTDASTAIARRYAEVDPERIRYLAHPSGENLGASATRNLGIAYARGEYLALLDSDDVWLPHKLEEQVRLLDAHPEAGAVYGPAFWWYSWTEETALAEDRLHPVGFPSGSIVPPPTLLKLFLLESVPVPLPSSMLLRRAVVDAVGGFEDNFRIVFTDQAFFTKLFLVTPVLATDGFWVKYRRHPDSSVSRVRRAGDADAAATAFLIWAGDYLNQRGMRGTPVWIALQRRLWRHRHPRLAGLMGKAKNALRQRAR
jgi:glycosyltransferase involved in cell wall biosynthesis